jgi:hypothetical protein
VSEAEEPDRNQPDQALGVTLAAVAEEGRAVVDVRMAAELTGAQPATIRAAVRRGA